MKKFFLASGFWLLTICGFASVDCIPAKPSPARFVNIFSNEFPDFLSTGEQQELENKLQDFNKETSNQIVVVIVDDLCGFEANEFCTRLGELWGVGQSKFDNGVVVMIKPTGGAGQRDAYIAVGYGLEGVIPDAIAKRILENEIIPALQNGNNFEALSNSTGILISLAKGEYSYKNYQRNGDENMGSFFIIFFIFIVILIIFMSRKNRGYTVSGSGRSYYGGGWSGGGSSGGGFGGGGGSFGGGSFGGGGAGGKW